MDNQSADYLASHSCMMSNLITSLTEAVAPKLHTCHEWKIDYMLSNNCEKSKGDYGIKHSIKDILA